MKKQQPILSEDRTENKTISKKGNLTLTGRQKDETEETAVTEYKGEVECFERNGSLYLLYEEITDEGSAVVKNRIKLKDSVLELTKQGNVTARMVFEPGKEYLTDYATPYGCLKMGIATHSLDIHRKEETLHIQIIYTLNSEGVPISHCTLDIFVDNL